jgi:hypothetical protein
MRFRKITEQPMRKTLSIVAIAAIVLIIIVEFGPSWIWG